jgi:hypothetical protein
MKDGTVEKQVLSPDQAFNQICKSIRYASSHDLRVFFRKYGKIFINRRCPETEMTLLSTAVQSRSFSLIKPLLDLDADPCIPDPDGITILIKISRIRFHQSPRLAILKRSDNCKDVPDADGRSALWWIVDAHAGMKSKGKEYFETVFSGFLHQARMADNEGVTPLMLAIKMNFTAAIEVFLGRVNGRCWSDLNAVDKKGNSVESYVKPRMKYWHMFLKARNDAQGDRN